MTARFANLNYERTGRPGAPTIVLLHGIGGELCVWEPVLEPLAEHFDVIALDLPGFGRSPSLPAALSPAPAALADAVEHFLDALEIDSAHVVGNSLGGWIALELGKSGRALSVTALCPAGLWPARRQSAAPPTRGRLNQIARLLRPIIWLLVFSRRLRRLALAHVVADPDKVPRSAVRRMISSYARATAYDATKAAMVSNNFADPQLVVAPTTLAFGEYDRLIRPSRVPIRGAQTVLLRGCGHIPMWDDPELVTEVIMRTAVGEVSRSA